MQTTFHLVGETTEDGGSLADVMKRINLFYAHCYRKRYRNIGARFFDSLLTKPFDLAALEETVTSLMGNC